MGPPRIRLPPLARQAKLHPILVQRFRPKFPIKSEFMDWVKNADSRESPNSMAPSVKFASYFPKTAVGSWARLRLLVILCAAAQFGRSQPGGPTSLPVLTAADQIRELTADDANRRYPVRLHAVVTYDDPGDDDFFVQDGTAGIYVRAQKHTLFQPGDVLEIEG